MMSMWWQLECARINTEQEREEVEQDRVEVR